MRRFGIALGAGGNPPDFVVRNGRIPDEGNRLLFGKIRRTDTAATAAFFTDGTGQFSRIDPVNAGDAELLHHPRERTGTAEIARQIVIIAHGERADVGDLRFVVLVADAAVADDGIRHHHKLIGVRGVGNDLLITDGRRVEHRFAHLRCRRAERVAVILGAVFKY